MTTNPNTTADATSALLTAYMGDGDVLITLTAEQARQGHHTGACDADIAELRQDEAIKAQLDALSPDAARDALKGYGAWDDAELADHDANLTRLLWLACGDITEDVANTDPN